MKVLLFALFVVAVTAIPVPEDNGKPVEMIVNGVQEGEALEVSDILDIKLNEHADGQLVSATNLLHPYTAFGIAEAAAAVAAGAVTDDIIPAPVVLPEAPAPEVIVPVPVVMPSPVAPEVVVPESIVMPSPAIPEVVVPEPVVMPSPAVPEVVVPEPIVLPAPAVPEVVVEPEELPVPAPQYPADGDLYNDGLVQVQYNGPTPGPTQEPSVLGTLQSWFNMVLNYFSDGVQTSQQIV